VRSVDIITPTREQYDHRPNPLVAVGGISITRLIRQTVCLSAADMHELRRLAAAKGGRARGYTISSEVAAAIKDYIKKQDAQHEEANMTPVWEQLLNEKFAQLEAWLRPGVWGGGTYSATAALLLLELMCGKQLDPAQAKDHFELIRGRAWKIIRRELPGDGS